jgi:hypothetical protein
MDLGTLLRKTHHAAHLFRSAEAQWQELPCAATKTKKCKSGVRRGGLHTRDGQKKHLPRQAEDQTGGDKDHVGRDGGLSSCLQQKTSEAVRCDTTAEDNAPPLVSAFAVHATYVDT